MGLSSGSSRRNAEEQFLPQTATEIARATDFPDVALTVVSSRIAAGLTTSPAQASIYLARQQRLAALSPRGRPVTTSKASFMPQISDSALVVAATSSSQAQPDKRIHRGPRHCGLVMIATRKW